MSSTTLSQITPESYLCAAEADTVVSLFRRQAGRSPNAVAVVSGDEKLTYRELESRAARLAQRLAQCGLTPGTVAGLSARPAPHRIVSLLAILMTGAAVLPLDSSYPSERLRAMLQAVSPTVLVTDDAAPWEGSSVPVFCTGEENGERGTANAPCAAALPDPDPATPCYILFTSGSTGGPKGVAMGHGALANLISWQIESAFRASADTLQFAPLGFDVSLQEIFATLCGGGSLHLLPTDHRHDPARLVEYLQTAAVQRLFLPYVALGQLAAVRIAGRIPSLPALREVIVAGEPLVITPAIRSFFAQNLDCALWNHYGPTETHVATAYRLEGTPQQWPVLPPIGPPITGLTAHVLDDDSRPVPFGDAGELYLGGAGVALGYFNQPEMTDERFVTLPAYPDWGRLYRTGDRARWTGNHDRSGAVLEFLGRGDDQVKVRGFRVEPGEVEQALLQHPDVAQAAVVARIVANPTAAANEDVPAEKQLVAYVVWGSDKGAAPERDMRPFLARTLPEWMLPARIVTLETMPLTPSGKVDRNALPAPPAERAALHHIPYVAPVGAREIAIAGVWASLLGWDRVGAEDSFFDLGGHSLLVVAAQQRLAAELNLSVDVALLFQYPTARSLAAHLSAPVSASVTDATGRPAWGGALGGAAIRASRARQAMIARPYPAR